MTRAISRGVQSSVSHSSAACTAPCGRRSLGRPAARLRLRGATVGIRLTGQSLVDLLLSTFEPNESSGGVVARLVPWPTVSAQVCCLDAADLFDQGLRTVLS